MYANTVVQSCDDRKRTGQQPCRSDELTDDCTVEARRFVAIPHVHESALAQPVPAMEFNLNASYVAASLWVAGPSSPRQGVRAKLFRNPARRCGTTNVQRAVPWMDLLNRRK